MRNRGGWALLAMSMGVVTASCNKSAAVVEYDLQYLDTSFPPVHVSEQAMGSGVVSGFGYNAGVYVVSYHRMVLPTGEARDAFLTFDVPVNADKVYVRNQLVTSNTYVRYEELTPDGEVLLVAENPTKAEFCVKELFMDDEGEPGGEIYFEIELPTRGLMNGVFRTDDSAKDVGEKSSSLGGSQTMQWAQSKCQ